MDNSQREEFNPSPSNAGGSEFQDGVQSAPSAAKKKSASFDKIITKILVGGAAVVTVSGFVLAPATAPEVSFTSLRATDTRIDYTVEVEEDAEGLIIVASNDFTRREASLSGGTNTGSFEGLKPNMSYKITVEQTSAFGGSIAEESVTTLTAEEAPVTALYSVTSECTCNVDGNFRFTMELVDEKGIWSEFEATLTDKYGTVSSCVFSQEITAEQVIDVVGAPLLGKTPQFVISCYDSELGQRRQLYSAEVKI